MNVCSIIQTKCPVQNGLRDIAMAEFWKNSLTVCETVERKLRGLPVDKGKYLDFADEIVDSLHLLRAVALRKYGAISMRAVLDILSAMDYFIMLRDVHEDSRDDGYRDDAVELKAAFQKHADEIEEFRRWFWSATAA